MTRNERPQVNANTDGTEPGEARMRTLVIRSWEEPDHDNGFRARLTYGDDQGDARQTFATADPEEALNLVRQWLLDRPGVQNKAP